jgi:hypothetical protein
MQKQLNIKLFYTLYRKKINYLFNINKQKQLIKNYNKSNLFFHYLLRRHAGKYRIKYIQRDKKKNRIRFTYKYKHFL